jgi:CBS domain-containing protein
MKILQNIITGAIILFLTSCSSTAKFPISSVTPAAEIVAKMKQDKNNNAVIEIIARNLASANRLNPPKNNYVVWIVTEDNGTKNIGQLMNNNGNKSILKTSTSFKVKEIYITAEEQGNISYPMGIEISRTSF